MRWDDPSVVGIASSTLYGWPVLPPAAHTIQPSWSGKAGKLGKLFEVTLTGAVLRLGSRSSEWYGPVMGLTFNLLQRDDASPAAARIRLELGSPRGGSLVVREFTLTRAGLWLVAAGWEHAKAEVIAVGDDGAGDEPGTVVTTAWTTHPPRPPSRLLLVESITATPAAGRPIPLGAVELATGAADAGWEWLTDQDGTGAVSVAQAQPGSGVVRRVLGARYLATAANTVTWFLEGQ